MFLFSFELIEMAKSLQSSLIDYRRILTQDFIKLSALCKTWKTEEFMKWFCLVNNREFATFETNMQLFFENGEKFENEFEKFAKIFKHS